MEQAAATAEKGNAAGRIRVLQQHLDQSLSAANAHRLQSQAALRAPGAMWTNNAQIGSCKPAVHHTPGTVEELCAIIKAIFKEKGKCRVVGAGKSPNHCTFVEPTGHLIHMDGLSKVLRVDYENMTIACEGGCMLGDVLRALEQSNMMLRCVPSIKEMTIAGAIATAAHSSGIHTGSIGSFVQSFKIVTGAGDIVSVSKASNPLEWSCLACNLGVLGVVVEVTLQAERKTSWLVQSDRISCKDVERVIAQRVMVNEFYRFWWTPHTDYCYESIGRRLSKGDDDGEAGFGGGRSSAAGSTRTAAIKEGESPSQAAARSKLQAVVHVLRPMPLDGTAQERWTRDQQSRFSRFRSAIANDFVKHRVLEAALSASNRMPNLQPYINRAYQRLFLNNSADLYGSSAECFTFDCLFRQWTAEWAIDAHRAMEAFHAIRAMIDANGLIGVHFPVEFRFADSDDILLSPAVGRKTCWVGVVQFKPYGIDAPETLRYLTLFSQEMMRLGGRPHWAKFYQLRHNAVAKMYGEGWKKFLLYRRSMDPGDIFVNAWFKDLITQ
jgi:L-gulonolactone oxidase